MAVRDNDQIDATLEGAPVADDGDDSEVLFAQSMEAAPVAAGRAPPPVTLPDMPAVTQVPGPLATTPSAPRPSKPVPPEPPRRAPAASTNAAATVVASLKDIAAAAGVKLGPGGLDDRIDFNESSEGGIIFDASAEGAPIDDGFSDDGGFAEDASGGFEEGATRPEVSAFANDPAKRPRPEAPARTVTPPPAPPASPPPAFTPPTSAPPRAAPADPTMLPPPTSLPGSPSFSFAPRTADPAPRRDTRGPVAGVGAGGGPLDPPVTPPRKETRGPVAGVGGALDPPHAPPQALPRKETRGPVAGVGGGGSGSIDPVVAPGGGRRADKPRRAAKAPAAETSMPGVMPVTGADVAGGRSWLGPVALGVVVVIGVVAFLSRSETTAVTLGPREARALSDRARAVLATQARSDVEDPVRGVVRTLIGEGGRVIVLRDTSIDAWVLPDSTFVVTDALLRRVGSDGQLAAIAAHTIAHHRLGHFGALGDSLDGPALMAALRARHEFDEEAADGIAGELLTKGGWRTRALVDAQEALGADTPWTARHPRQAQAITNAMGGASGARDDKDWYRQKVLAVLDPPPPPPPIAIVPAAGN